MTPFTEAESRAYAEGFADATEAAYDLLVRRGRPKGEVLAALQDYLIDLRHWAANGTGPRPVFWPSKSRSSQWPNES